MSFTGRVKDMANEYGAEVSDLSVGLAIEAFKDIRNYPSSLDVDQIDRDVEANLNKIAMAAVEIDSKDGTENQISHSENGISRGYYEGIMAYKGVIGYAHIA